MGHAVRLPTASSLRRSAALHRRVRATGLGAYRPEPAVLHPVRAGTLFSGSSHSVPHVRPVFGRHPRCAVARLDWGRDRTVRLQGRRYYLEHAAGAQFSAPNQLWIYLVVKFRPIHSCVYCEFGFFSRIAIELGLMWFNYRKNIVIMSHFSSRDCLLRFAKWCSTYASRLSCVIWTFFYNTRDSLFAPLKRIDSKFNY